MEKEKAKKRLIKLRAEIDYHRYKYHVLDQETISPSALDSLKKELVELEEKFPDLITKDSPSQRVAGSPLKKFKKKEHLRPMTSLNDVFSMADLLAWEKRNYNYLNKLARDYNEELFSYYGELKLDGLAVSLVYNQSLFSYGLTRGDGLVGEDISHNLKTISSLPLKLKVPELADLKLLGLSKAKSLDLIEIVKEKKVEIRGEAIMPISVFEEVNRKNKRQGLALLANSRNGAAGSLRQLDSKIAKARKLDFYAYDVFLADKKIGEIIESRQALDKLASLLGFKVLIDNRFLKNLKEVDSFQAEILKKRAKLDYQIDGIVVKINQLKYWSLLGIVGKAPRYMAAYKFPAEQVTTKVKAVDWLLGRTGILTPIAILEAVNIGGVIVKRASLHNYEEIKRLGLKIGDTVIVERAGDVIPKVIKVLSNLRIGSETEIVVPSICPQCGHQVSQVDNLVAFRCLNNDCQEIRVRRLIHFVSKTAFDIVGLGKNIVILLFKQGLVNTAADFFKLKEEDLLNLESFKEKKAKNIILAIKEKKTIDLARFIFSLGILNIGETSAQLIAKTFSLEKDYNTDLKIKPRDFLAWAKAKNISDWEKLDDFGEIVAESLVDFWQTEANISLINELSNLGLRLRALRVNREIKKFVFTGKLTKLTRQEAKDKIKIVGGEVKNSLSADIDYLVKGKEPGSKYEEAKKRGIKIISEDEFLKFI